MTAKVIPFPQRSEPNLTEIEKLIRQWLAEMSSNNELIEHVAGRMMDFIDKYTNKTFEPTFNLAVPPNLTEAEVKALLASIEKGADNTADQVHRMINEIIVERFFLEIDLYESSRKESSLSIQHP